MTKELIKMTASQRRRMKRDEEVLYDWRKGLREGWARTALKDHLAAKFGVCPQTIYIIVRNHGA